MKNIKNVVIILIINIILIALSSISFATTGKINSETVRMRKGPSTETGIVMLISIEEEVEILGKEGDFYKVKYENTTGYISKNLVDTENQRTSENILTTETLVENNQETTTATDNNAGERTETNEESIQTEQTENQENTEKQQEILKEKNFSKGEKITLSNAIEIKILPVIYSTNIATVEANTEIEVLEIMNSWCKVEKGGISGWTRKTELIKEEGQDLETVETNTEPEENEEQLNTKTEENNNTQGNTEPEENKIGYVNVDTVNVRKETNTSCTIIGQLSKNTEVEIIEELQGWYKIKSGNISGYIASKYISDQKVVETTSRGSVEERNPVENVDSDENIETIQTELSNEQNTEETQEQIQSTNDNIGEKIVSLAKTYLKYKYVSGGASPSTGFDCSGFTVYIYKQFGVSLSRTSAGQATNGTAVEKSNLQLGDLVIFNNDDNTKIGHVGIYVGDNNFIHASNPSDGVKITSLSNSYYQKRYVGARRVI